MTPIAPYMAAFLREYLPNQRGASQHTCDSYAQGFGVLFNFASQRLQVAPSALALEQIDAALVSVFLEYLEQERHNAAATRNVRALWLGHTSTQTTGIYTRVDPSEKLDAIEALVPPTLRRGRFRPPDKLIALLKGSSLRKVTGVRDPGDAHPSAPEHHITARSP